VKSDRTVVLDVEPSTRVEAVKTAAGVTGFRLIFAGRHLEDTQTLAQCGIKVRSSNVGRLSPLARRVLLDTRGV
jgi:Ubiquitin family